ncbi:MAG TPA: hypothetical protein PKE06_11855 [Flavilitoribacter sp.]|nr:hypothetical protein [Lewinella sp.]MCB9279413.1 hypothetical protein [Lewinellaceae bacterium]HMQ61355.1 hypothetical protein [Flavilitoribacter sp.]HMQ88357.1 hypothetical protein [Flavilitoribacter sp.]
MKIMFSKMFSLQTKFAFVLGLALLVIGTSCKKNDDNEPENKISNDELEAIVEGSLVANYQGIAKEAFDAAVITEASVEKTTTTLECGETRDTSVTWSFGSGNVSAGYNGLWTWTLNCTPQSLPTSLVYTRNTNGQYESARLKAMETATGQWVVSNLTTGLFYVLNGSYSRQGSQMFKIGNQNTFSSTTQFTVTDLKVNKITKLIDSGLATLVISGEGTTGYSFNHTGSVEFLGDGSAIVTVNGHTWTVDLY